MNGRRCFIFGCGYVGAALARRWLAEGAQVGALTRNPETADALRAAGLNPVVEARLDGDAWHAPVGKGWDVAVNSVSSAGGGLDGYRASYVAGMRSLLVWAKQASPGLILYTGSTAVYPDAGGAEVYEFSASPHSERAAVLLEAENLLAQGFSRETAWAVLRLAGIYGPGRHLFLDRFLAETAPVFPGSSDYYLNLIHRDDAVGALACASDVFLQNPVAFPSGVYQLADGQPATKGEIVRWLAQTLGRPPPRFDPEMPGPRSQALGASAPNRRILPTRYAKAFGWKPQFPQFQAGYREFLSSFAD